MSVGTIMTILSIVNTLFSIAKDAPAVIAEAKSLLAKVKPHVDAAGDEVKQAFEKAQASLV